jgi:hypothetical protein
MWRQLPADCNGEVDLPAMHEKGACWMRLAISCLGRQWMERASHSRELLQAAHANDEPLSANLVDVVVAAAMPVAVAMDVAIVPMEIPMAHAAAVSVNVMVMMVVAMPMMVAMMVVAMMVMVVRMAVVPRLRKRGSA